MRGRHEEPAPALPKNRLGSGMDRQTDTQVAETVYQVYGLDASVPTQTAKEVQEEREGQTDSPVQEGEQSCVCPLHPRMSPVLTYFCFSASFLCSEVSAHSALLSMLERRGSAASPAAGDVPSLCSAGGHSHAGDSSHGHQGPQARGQVLAPRPTTSQGCSEAHRGTQLGIVTATLVQQGGRYQGVPLVLTSSGCFFQGRPRSFKGDGSGSRRWSCCSRSSRLRAASSTGAGSAGCGVLVRGGVAPLALSHLPWVPTLLATHPRAATLCTLLKTRTCALPAPGHPMGCWVTWGRPIE